MKAVYISSFGGPENLEIRDVPDPPRPNTDEVLVRVRAAGLNRADLLQRQGLYPAPEGYSPNIPGLEFAGEIVEAGARVPDAKPGDRVFGITAGEAQAEYLTIEHSLITRIPEDLTFTDAAAVPEAFITAHDAVFTLGALRRGETLLIHAVGSGVGLAALQLAKAAGAKVIGTSRTLEKLEKCEQFGLDEPILTADAPDLAERIMEITGGKGVNVVLDLVGAAFFEQNLKGIAEKGRLILVGLTSGSKAEIDLARVLHRRATLIGTVLRARPVVEKAAAVAAFAQHVVPLLYSGAVKPNVDKVFSVHDVCTAHEYLTSNKSFGKVVLEF
jgi:putative PIG3 family NAD(P)H quinone oxidoreductase